MLRNSSVKRIGISDIIIVSGLAMKNIQSVHDLNINKKGELLQPPHLFRDPAGARTQDPILKRDVLYQLSY
jgi:hypothetical protein